MIRRFLLCGFAVFVLALWPAPEGARGAEKADRSLLPVLARHLPSLKQMALAGDVQAQYTLGVLYASGKTAQVPRDMAEAHRWFLLAAQHGLPLAQVRTGLAYAQGEGVARNDTAAFEWMKRAALQGHELGQFYIGLAYDQGLGVGRDAARAQRWLRLAASQGNSEADLRLAFLYLKGAGGDKAVTARAVASLERAGLNGVADAQLVLGEIYTTGYLVGRDAARARRWLRAAALQGLPAAQYMLGELDLDRRRLREAYAWFLLARAGGEDKARQALEAMEARLSKSELSRARQVRAVLAAQIADHRAAQDDDADERSYAKAAAAIDNAVLRIESPQALRIEGTLGPETAGAVAETLRKNPKISILILDSPGGLLLTAVHIADLVERRRLVTIADQKCLSACTMLLFASHYPSARPESVIGFHKPTPIAVRNASGEALRAAGAEGEWLAKMRYAWSGFPPELIRSILKVSGNALYIASKRELIGHGLLKGIFKGSARDGRLVSARAWCRSDPRRCAANPSRILVSQDR